MLLKVSFSLLILAITLRVALTIQYYDPNEPLELYFTANPSTFEQYALFITAQSTIEANFFRFQPNTPMFPSLISISQLVPTTQTVTLTYQNIFTNAQAVAASMDTASCVTQTSVDCSTDPSTQPVCGLLAPIPAQPGIQNLTLEDLNCTTTNENPLCELSWSNTDLIDSLGGTVLASSDLLCPEAVIQAIITLSVLKADLNEPYIADRGNITFHYLPITPVDSNFWMLTGSIDRFGEPADVSTNSTQPLVILSDTNVTDFDYATIIKTRLMSHNHTVDLYCRYELNYTGIVRGIFINDYESGVHAPSGIGLDTETQYVSSIRLVIRANELNYVNIFGYNITQTDLQFIDCQENWNGDAVPSVYVDFSTYSYGEPVASSQDYQIQGQTYGCGGTCTRCADRGTCIRCSTPLFQARCTPCPVGYSFPDYRNICNTVLQPGAVLIEPYDASSGQTSLTFFNDYVAPNPSVLVLYSESQVLISPGPLAWLSGVYLLGESVSTLLVDLEFGLTTIHTTLDPAEAEASENTILLPSDTTLNFGEIKAVYFPLLDVLGFLNVYWDLNGQAPVSQNDKLDNWEDISNLNNSEYMFMTSSTYQIFEAFVNCVSECEISVGSDGRVQLFKNDRTLMFDVKFYSLWTYIYGNITGFMNLKFIVTNATYFQPNITGGQIYAPGYPFFNHTFLLPNATSPATNVSNCLNSQDQTCLSCQSGYFLSPDQATCTQDCDTGYYISAVDGACKPSCSVYQVLNPVTNECQPICDTPGYYYQNNLGCQLCVADCAVCSSANTCSQCRFPDASDNSTHCGRKQGTLYTQQNFSASQTVSMLINPNTQLAIVIADQSITGDLIFYFNNLPRKVPRILKVFQMETSGTNPDIAELTLPPIPIAESGTISIHYVEIIQDVNLSNFTINAFRDDNYGDWPLVDTIGVPHVDLSIGPFLYSTPAGILLDPDDYETVIATRLYKHDQPDQLTCRVQLTLQGALRGLFANEELILMYSTNSIRARATSVSKPFVFAANELLMMVFVGYGLNINSVTFVNCTNSAGSSITPTLESYIISGFDATSDDFVVANNTYCGPNCVRCRDNSQCLHCDTDFYLVNGSCQSKCPTGQIQLIFGSCDTKIKQPGFNFYSGFFTGVNQLKVEYILFLGFSSIQVLVIAHPFLVNVTSHAAYVFTPDDTPSLTEGAYLINTYTSTDSMLVSQLTVKSQAAVAGQDSGFLIYTMRPNVVLFFYYSSFPTTIDDLLEADAFEYIPLTNQPILVQQQNTYFLDFFINCTGNCSITFELEGNIEITLNERTYLFGGYVESFVGPITLSRTLQNLNHLVIEFWNTTNFTLNIQGTYSVFSLGDLIAQDGLQDVAAQACTAQNCLNCYQNKCFSCIDGYYLTSARTCVQTCPAGTSADPFERVCKTTINCSISTVNSAYVNLDGVCVPNCINSPGFYYNKSTGCTSPCDSSCERCFGPLASQCLSCPSSRSLALDNTCVCTLGISNFSSGECYPTSLALQIEPYALACDTVQFQAIPEEVLAANTAFYWELVSSDASSTSQTSIQNLLVSQSAQIFTLQKNLFEENQSYNFSVYYFNALNDKIENWILFETVYNVLPNFTISGGDTQELDAYISHTLQVTLNSSQCLLPNLTAIWTVVSGTITNSNLLLFASYPLEAVIPSCLLAFNTSIVIKARIWNTQYPSLYSERTQQFYVNPEVFEALVLTDDHQHPENVDLQLNGTIEYYDHCQTRQQGNIYYWWTCNNVTAAQACQDNNGLFNVKRSTGELTVPQSSFSNGQILEFNFFVEKNGVIQNDTLNINVTSVNTFIIDSNIASNCLKYSTNKDCIVTAMIKLGQVTLTRQDYQNLTFNWQTTPLVPFAYFQDIMKLLSSQNQLPANTRSLLVQFSVMNATHNGLSHLSLPINYPPYGGTLAVIPSVGVSLSTYFTISADGWQDDDVPLAYQYYYSFEENSDYTPILYPYSSVTDIVSILPSQYTGALVYVRVNITDFLGATSTATTYVKVNSDNKSVEQKIQQYTDILQSSSRNNNTLPSGITIGMVSKALSDLENEISANVSSPVCPACSNHGSCPTSSSKCVCTNGWSLADCSEPTSVVNQIIDLKEQYLQALAEQCENNDDTGNPEQYQDAFGLDQDNCQDALLDALEEAAGNVDFNNNGSLTLVQQILDNTLHILDSDTELEVPDEVNALADILNSMLEFASQQDCSKSTQFTQGLESVMTTYLEKISESTLNQKIASENATVIDTDNIDMYFQKLSLCDLQNKTIFAGNDAPKASLTINSDVHLNCSTEVNLQYYAINSNLFNCSYNASQNNTKDVIGVKISDPTTGADVNVNVGITITPLPDCPSVCVRLENEACSCSNISPFNVKSQIIKIFEQSNVAEIINIEALLGFQFWKSVSFWGVTSFTLLFLVNLLILKLMTPNYSCIHNFRHVPVKTKIRIFWTAFLAMHPLLSIFCIVEPKFSKRTRALLYFTRNLLILAVTSLFSQPSQEPSFGIQFSNFNVYLFLLPFMSVIPLCLFIGWLIKNPPKQTQNKKKGILSRIYAKLKASLGYIVIAILSLISLMVIFILDANQTSGERLAWTVDFVQSILQDLCLTPFIDLLVQYLGFKFHSLEYCRKRPKLQKIVFYVLEEQLVELKEILDEKEEVSLHHKDSQGRKTSIFSGSNGSSPEASSRNIFETQRSTRQIKVKPKKSLEIAIKPKTIQEASVEESPYVKAPEERLINNLNQQKTGQSKSDLYLSDLEGLSVRSGRNNEFMLKLQPSLSPSPQSSQHFDEITPKISLHIQSPTVNSVYSLGESVFQNSPEYQRLRSRLNSAKSDNSNAKSSNMLSPENKSEELVKMENALERSKSSSSNNNSNNNSNPGTSVRRKSSLLSAGESELFKFSIDLESRDLLTPKKENKTPEKETKSNPVNKNLARIAKLRKRASVAPAPQDTKSQIKSHISSVFTFNEISDRPTTAK